MVPEDIERYPEQFFFGVLPAWGAYIRHASNVEFRNVELVTRAPDQRNRIILDDAKSYVEHLPLSHVGVRCPWVSAIWSGSYVRVGTPKIE
jgi:hypothetical protein